MSFGDIDISEPPRKGKFASTPGSYTLVVESNQPFAYRGTTITLRMFISGYGMISSPKLFILMPPNLHDEERSYIYYNLGKSSEGTMTFGAKKDKLLQSTTFGFGGIKGAGWDESTFMVDMHEVAVGSPTVLTETSQERAPFEIEVRVKDFSLSKSNLKPGRHSAQFVLTYFNGELWVSSKTTYDFVLPTFYQRYTLLTWMIGALFALAGVAVAIVQLVVQLGTSNH